MSAISEISSIRSRVDDLRIAAVECEDLQRIANPYFQAVDWEKETGRVVAEAVGTNGAYDMCAAVNRLTEFAQNCKDCGVSDAVCQFAGVETMSQEEILTLVEVGSSE